VATIYFALDHAPVDEEQNILTDSLSAIRLLCRWRRERFSLDTFAAPSTFLGRPSANLEQEASGGTLRAGPPVVQCGLPAPPG
jgi:hypothetical protein